MSKYKFNKSPQIVKHIETENRVINQTAELVYLIPDLNIIRYNSLLSKCFIMKLNPTKDSNKLIFFLII